ncbi:ABC transporter permease [Agrobacterium tumefaciens]|uniref:ABC transporter permease n=1 Tax=Agrobacterium tumefaciens complex TaxID=1183400 RepID=UPI000458CB47|nr:ABC transporter permease [Agrobacterium tumefaciens]AMD56941.1 ABC transporter permease [Agrobacterium tumefaciens]KAJ34146.1 ABC transporter permease [Agrobacterium tumefaciens]UNZ52551.1 ABC transporter permease [Agrobacterium tumefaciens]
MHPSVKRPTISKAQALLITPALLILLLAAIIPVVLITIYSFLTPGEYGGIDWTFSTESWVNVVLKRDFFTNEVNWATEHLVVFWRSIKLSIMTALLTFLFGFPAAYFIATRPPHRRDFWLTLIMLPFWTNMLIRTFAMMQLIRNEGVFNNVLVGLGIISSPVQILYTETAIMLGMTYVYLPLMVLPIYSSMERFDFRLVEAGYDLYARPFQIMREIILPVVKPGVVAGVVLVLIPCLGDYVITTVLGGGKQLLLGNLIGMQFSALRNWPLGSALSLTLLIIVGIAMIVFVRATEKEESVNG